MSRLDKFTGSMTLSIDGKDFPVKVSKEQKWELMRSRQAIADKMERKIEVTAEDQKRVYDALASIVKSSEPEATDDEVEGFLVQNENEFQLELYIAFRLLKREDVEREKAKLFEEVRPKK